MDADFATTILTRNQNKTQAIDLFSFFGLFVISSITTTSPTFLKFEPTI